MYLNNYGLEFKREYAATTPVLVSELSGSRCPRCVGPVGMGLKEEVTGWKIYLVCLDTTSECSEKGVGTVPRGSVDHLDEVVSQGENMINNSGFVF